MPLARSGDNTEIINSNNCELFANISIGREGVLWVFSNVSVVYLCSDKCSHCLMHRPECITQLSASSTNANLTHSEINVQRQIKDFEKGVGAF